MNVTGTDDLPIVDTLQHLWDLGRFRLPWLQGAGPINRSFIMKDYGEIGPTRHLRLPLAQ